MKVDEMSNLLMSIAFLIVCVGTLLLGVALVWQGVQPAVEVHYVQPSQ